MELESAFLAPTERRSNLATHSVVGCPFQSAVDMLREVRTYKLKMGTWFSRPTSCTSIDSTNHKLEVSGQTFPVCCYALDNPLMNVHITLTQC